jgi:hypothetical protein
VRNTRRDRDRGQITAPPSVQPRSSSCQRCPHETCKPRFLPRSQGSFWPPYPPSRYSEFSGDSLKLEIVSSPLDVGNRWAEDVIEMTGPRAERFSSHDHHLGSAGSSRWSKLPLFLFPVRRSVKLRAAPLSNFQNVDRPTRAARNPPAMRRWVTVRFGTVPRRLGLNRGE